MRRSAEPGAYVEPDLRVHDDLLGGRDAVGVQLGRGHVKQKRKQDERRLQRALLAGLPVCDLVNLSATLADATEEAWRRFRQAGPGGR